MLQRFADAMLRPSSPITVFLLGLYTVLWGTWIASPWWEVFDRAPLYSQMASFAPEWCFGLVAIWSGLMVCRGAVHGSSGAVMVGSLIGCLHWGAISVLYFSGDWQNTGGITTLFLALLSGFIYLNESATIRTKTRSDPC